MMVFARDKTGMGRDVLCESECLWLFSSTFSGFLALPVALFVCVCQLLFVVVSDYSCPFVCSQPSVLMRPSLNVKSYKIQVEEALCRVSHRSLELKRRRIMLKLSRSTRGLFIKNTWWLSLQSRKEFGTHTDIAA